MQIGVNIISPRGAMPYPQMLNVISAAGVRAVKFHIANKFSTDPLDVEQAIKRGVSTVVLRTDDGLAGYEYQIIRDLIEQPGGVGGFSYAYLFNKYPNIEWWIEVGNEPNKAGMDGWHARWWALAAAKELRLNYLGHIDQPWAEKYPMLKWSVCLPTSLADTVNMLAWQDNHGSDDVGDGSIIDYYDALNCHIYGDFQLGDNYDWPKIYSLVTQNAYTKQVNLTEFGINDPNTPMYIKKQRERNWLLSQASNKTTLAFSWCLGRTTGYPTYEYQDPAVVSALLGG